MLLLTFLAELPGFDPNEYADFLQDAINWGVEAGMAATSFITGMALLSYMFKD